MESDLFVLEQLERLARHVDQLQKAVIQLQQQVTEINKRALISFQPHCDCSTYRKGSLSGGHHCPLHGQIW